jgi:GntR family transcriptional regulator/MocR family aminotransferase
MKYVIDKTSKKPAYLLLYEQLRGDITVGVYPYGTKLPSKRLLAEESGVSVVTVEHSYTLLCDEGYIEARERSGYYVIYRESDFMSSADTGEAEDAVRGDHQAGEFDFPFSVMAKTMRKVLLDRGEDILVKSPNNGCPELRRAIAGYLARSNGMTVKPEQVIIGSGAEYLYSLIAQLLKGRTFALEDPSYNKIRQVYTACGVECDMLKLGKNGIRSSELTRTSATVLHITPFNSFPSGITAGASKRMEYIRWAESREGYIVEDNYDSELTVSTKNEDTVYSLSSQSRVIYLNTFSHTVAPSMRVGYMVLPESLIGYFEEKLGFYSCTVPVFEQYVLAELMTSGNFERHINRVRRKKRRERL